MAFRRAPQGLRASIFLTMAFILGPSLAHAMNSLGCQTLEIRVAAESPMGPVYREGMGSQFKASGYEDQRFLVTAAHVVADAALAVGVCENQIYSLTPVGVDTSVDLAVLKIEGLPTEKLPLFDFNPQAKGQVLKIETISPTEFRNLNWDGYFELESSDAQFFNPTFYLPHQKPGSSDTEYIKKRIVLSLNFDNLKAKNDPMFPGSPSYYEMTNIGVRPGMSGAPLLYEQTTYSPTERPWHRAFQQDPKLIGIVSKTKINSNRTALIPFSLVFERLSFLLNGGVRKDLSLQQNQLRAFGFVFNNLGDLPYINSSSDYLLKLPSTKPAPKLKQTMTPGQLREILLNPKNIRTPQRKIVKKSTRGGDWGEGSGDLMSEASNQSFLSGPNGMSSFFIDSTSETYSGVQDQSGNKYYGWQNGSQFNPIASIYDLLPISKDLNRISTYGVQDPTKALDLFCQGPAWTSQSKLSLASTFVLQDLSTVSMNSSAVGPRNLRLNCENQRPRIYLKGHDLHLDVVWSADRTDGQFSVAGCQVDLHQKETNLWQRDFHNEFFEARVTMAGITPDLVKITIFKIKKTCEPQLENPDIYSTTTPFISVSIQRGLHE